MVFRGQDWRPTGLQSFTAKAHRPRSRLRGLQIIIRQLLSLSAEPIVTADATRAETESQEARASAVPDGV